MPEGKSTGMEGPGMEHSGTCEAAMTKAAHTSKTAAAHASHASKPAAAHASHASKSAVAHASNATKSAMAHPTHPGRRAKRRTGDDGRCRGQCDQHLAHHDASSIFRRKHKLFLGPTSGESMLGVRAPLPRAKFRQR